MEQSIMQVPWSDFDYYSRADVCKMLDMCKLLIMSLNHSLDNQNFLSNTDLFRNGLNEIYRLCSIDLNFLSSFLSLGLSKFLVKLFMVMTPSSFNFDILNKLHDIISSVEHFVDYGNLIYALIDDGFCKHLVESIQNHQEWSIEKICLPTLFSISTHFVGDAWRKDHHMQMLIMDSCYSKFAMTALKLYCSNLDTDDESYHICTDIANILVNGTLCTQLYSLGILNFVQSIFESESSIIHLGHIVLFFDEFYNYFQIQIKIQIKFCKSIIFKMQNGFKEDLQDDVDKDWQYFCLTCSNFIARVLDISPTIATKLYSSTIDEEVIEIVKNFDEDPKSYIELKEAMKVARRKPVTHFLRVNNSYFERVNRSKTQSRKLNMMVDVFTDKICLHYIISYL